MLTKLYRFQQKFAQIKAKILKNFQNFERQPTYLNRNDSDTLAKHKTFYMQLHENIIDLWQII